MIHLAPGTYLLDNAPFVFNAGTRASDVRLVGALGTTLQAASPNVSLFKVGAGAPTVTLVGLRMHSQVFIDGGALNVQNCTFEESGAELGGAVHVKGGSLAVKRTVFEGCKATRGGAAWVSGGVAIFSSCTFKDCTSIYEKGGGLQSGWNCVAESFCAKGPSCTTTMPQTSLTRSTLLQAAT